MSGIHIHKLDFDPAAPTENQRVGSYLIGLGGDVVTTTTVSAIEALDVNIAAATGFAIFAEDSAHTDEDIGQHVLAVRQDTLASSVDTDGDYGSFKINSLGELYVHDTDVLAELVLIKGDTAAIATSVDNIDTTLTGIATDVGNIDDTLTALSKAEDAAHTTGDRGVMALVVRNDAGTSLVGSDGDYAPLQVNASGALRTTAEVVGTVADDAADSGNPIKVGGRAQSTATAISAVSAANDRFDLSGDLYRRLFVNEAFNVGWQTSVATIGTSAAELAATPLVGRKSVIIQNRGNASIYLGNDNTVTTSSGIELPKNASMEFMFGEALNMWAISGSAGNNVRVLEAA